jgi:hypothetical protein
MKNIKHIIITRANIIKKENDERIEYGIAG